MNIFKKLFGKKTLIDKPAPVGASPPVAATVKEKNKNNDIMVEKSKMSTQNRFQDLIVRLESSDKETRYNSSDALVSLGTPAIPYLISKLLYYTNEEARGMALWTIGEICPRVDDQRIDLAALSPLLAGLTHQNSKTRQAAAWALGRLRTNLAVDQLITALKDDDAIVCQAAAEALKMIKDPRGLQALETKGYM